MIRDWKARWYAEGDKYADLLHEDLEIRRFIQETMERAGISRVEIERFPNQVAITIWTARPGVVIGRKGASVKQLRDDLKAMTYKRVSKMCRRWNNLNWTPSWWQRTLFPS